MPHRRIRIPVFTCAVLLVLLRSVASEPPDRWTADKLWWLHGAWGGEKDGVYSEEHWMVPRGGSLVGMHRDVKGGRTTSFEFMRIEEQDGRLVYLASPRGAPPTSFTAIDRSPEQIIFENSDHDFPQRIWYWREGGVLHAKIEGTLGGKLESEVWQWERLDGLPKGSHFVPAPKPKP